MMEKFEAAHNDHKVWKTKMSTHAKELNWLEIKLREEELSKDFSSMSQSCHEHGSSRRT